MKKFYLPARLVAVFFLAVLLITGCKKEKSDTLSPAEEEEAANYTTKSETETEIVFNDVFNNVMGVNAELGFGGTGVFERTTTSGGLQERELNVDTLPSCVTVTTQQVNPPNAFPVRVTMDFGSGCLSNHHLRSGKIISTYTGGLRFPGNSVTIGFENFKIDSVAVAGTLTVTNTTAAGSNQRQFTFKVTDARLTRPNGDYSLWTSQRVITQIEGNGTLLPQDDIFRIEGFARGRIKHGNLLYAWASEIIRPLIKKFFCPWISKGTLLVRRESLPSNSQWVAELNYGDGTCDYFATISIGGAAPRTITLPH